MYPFDRPQCVLSVCGSFVSQTIDIVCREFSVRRSFVSQTIDIVCRELSVRRSFVSQTIDMVCRVLSFSMIHVGVPQAIDTLCQYDIVPQAVDTFCNGTFSIIYGTTVIQTEGTVTHLSIRYGRDVLQREHLSDCINSPRFRRATIICFSL